MLMSISRRSRFDETWSRADRHSSRPIAQALRNIRDAMREALAAHRQYERLMSGGAPHDTALREALGIDHSTCACRAATCSPLGSQGNAGESVGNLSYVK